MCRTCPHLKTDQPTATHDESHSDSDLGMFGSGARPGAVMEGALLLPELPCEFDRMRERLGKMRTVLTHLV